MSLSTRLKNVLVFMLRLLPPTAHGKAMIALWRARRFFWRASTIITAPFRAFLRQVTPYRVLRGCVTDAYQQHISGAEITGLTIHLVRPPHQMHFTGMPREIYTARSHKRFEDCRDVSVPAAMVMTLHDGHVFGESGAIATAEMSLIADASFEMGRSWGGQTALNHSGFARLALPAPIRLPGRTLSFATPSGGAFFHWLWNQAARMALIRAAGLTIDSFDNIYMNLSEAPYQMELLKTLQIPREKVIPATNGAHYCCDELVTTSHVPVHLSFPDWAIKEIRSLTRPVASKTMSRRIFIDRQGGRWRKLKNRSEIHPILERHGFAIIQLETMSFAEQASTFAAADVVIGVHGAGFSLLAYCRPQTQVLEMFSPNYVNNLYWRLANECELRYNFLLGKGALIGKDILPDAIADDVSVPPDLLAQWLNDLPS